MLSPDHAETVRATLPAVAAHGSEITGRFYASMFDAHPELRNLFNMGNQANGEQRQALAGSVAAFAQQLTGDGPAFPFEAMVARIAHKHASLGIRPEQYTIVGRHLLEAVGEVLGDAVTPEVHAAWSEVYWLFATLLVAEEARLYQAAHLDPADLYRPWRVVARRTDAADVASFVLKPADGGEVPPFLPGQYVSVAVDLPGGLRQPRQYSLSRAADGAAFQITVRRVRGEGGAPDGTVSNYLHDNIAVGDQVEVGPPFGDVALQDGPDPLVLVSAGIGITPAAAMLDHLAAAGSDREVLLLHADRSPATHPLIDQVTASVRRLPRARAFTWYEEPEGAEEDVLAGRIDVAALPVPLPAKARVHLCGPIPFMRGVRRGLLAAGVDEDRITYEVFGPDLWNRAD
ncbi:globin domain-containing protein [Spirillospora sp. NPDC050679]